jgi:excisionase family DNA binding protein
MMNKLDGYLRIKKAAEYLGVSPNTLRNWGREGKITEHRHLTRLLRQTEKPRA